MSGEVDPLRDAVASVIARAGDPLLAALAADMIVRAVGEALGGSDVYQVLDQLEVEATRYLGPARPVVNRRDKRAAVRRENKERFGRYSG